MVFFLINAYFMVITARCFKVKLVPGSSQNKNINIIKLKGKLLFPSLMDDETLYLGVCHATINL